MLLALAEMESELCKVKRLVERCTVFNHTPSSKLTEGITLAEELLTFLKADVAELFGWTDYEYTYSLNTHLPQFNFYLANAYHWVLKLVRRHGIQISDIVGNAARPLILDTEAHSKEFTSLASSIHDAICWLERHPTPEKTFPGLKRNASVFIQTRMPLLYENIDRLLSSPREQARLIALDSRYSVSFGYGNIPILNTPIGSISKLNEIT